MSKQVILLLAVLVIVSAAGVWSYVQNQSGHTTHYHAGFQIYQNGDLQDYSGAQYMHIEECTTEEDAVIEKIDRAHLHNSIGDVVHVHTADARWSDLLTNLGVTITEPLIAYRNGKRLDELTNSVIQPYESVIFVIGQATPSGDIFQSAVTKERIRYAEQQTESCGK